MEVKEKKILPYVITLMVSGLMIFFFYHWSLFETFSSYQSLGLWHSGAWGVLVSLFVLFGMLVTMLMIVEGILGLLDAFGKIKININYEKTNFILLLIYAIITVFEFIWLIVFCATLNATFTPTCVFIMVIALVALFWDIHLIADKENSLDKNEDK